MLRDDVLLGVLRCCVRCGEWWPDDEEFYHPSMTACRACLDEVRAETNRSMRAVWAAASRRYRERLRGVTT